MKARREPELYDAKCKAAALLHLMHAHCCQENSEGVMSAEHSDLQVGLMTLCQDVIAELDEACAHTHTKYRALHAAAHQGGAK